MRGWARIARKARLPVGYLATALLLGLGRGGSRGTLIGALPFLGGVGLRLWAAGHLRKNRELTTSGPFAHLRHPLYLGTLLVGLGYAIMSGRRWGLPLVLGLFLAFYLPTMVEEERHLEGLFGERYREYKRNVPMLLPRLSPWRGGGRRRFDLGLLKKNREHLWALYNLGVFALFVVANSIGGRRRK